MEFYWAWRNSDYKLLAIGPTWLDEDPLWWANVNAVHNRYETEYERAKAGINDKLPPIPTMSFEEM